MKIRIVFLMMSLFFFFGCAGLQPGVPEPAVSINSFKVLPSNSLAPRFEIGMRVVNTGRNVLKIEGLVYTVSLAGSRILTGVANNIPDIQAYSESNVTVSGSADIFGGLGFLKQMISQQKEAISYEIDVSMDTGALYPMIHSTKKGEFSLSEALKAKN